MFAAFKLAVIIQQIYIRFVRGQTQDERFRYYYRRVLGLAAKARVLAGLGLFDGEIREASHHGESHGKWRI